jgi:hypothetical protein
MEGLAVMVESVLAGSGIDRHAADGVAHGGAAMSMPGMIVMPAAAARIRVPGVCHRYLRGLLATHTR